MHALLEESDRNLETDAYHTRPLNLQFVPHLLLVNPTVLTDVKSTKLESPVSWCHDILLPRRCVEISTKNRNFQPVVGPAIVRCFARDDSIGAWKDSLPA